MTDSIGYQAMTQRALKSVVREALEFAATQDRLPGDHHFYISFRTGAPGVEIAEYLTKQFPFDMTIVVQHQFWDLEVKDDHFEIILKFSGVPQHLSIPFAAVTRFADPSVNFALNFEIEDAASSAAKKGSHLRVAGSEGEASPAPEKAAKADAEAPDADKGDADNGDADEGDGKSTVVRLDAFRRKTP